VPELLCSAECPPLGTAVKTSVDWWFG